MTARGYDTTGYAISDSEERHKKRLATINSRYPSLAFYLQTDPRGCPVYICKKGDACQDRYTSGCAVIV